MFLRHFFQKKMQEDDFLFLFFLPVSNKNNVPTRFRKNFRLLISGAAVAPEFNQPYLQGKWRPD